MGPPWDSLVNLTTLLVNLPESETRRGGPLFAFSADRHRMNLHEAVQRIEGEFKGETTRIEPLVGRGGDPTRMDVLQRAETVTKHGATDDEEGEYYEWLD